MFSGMPTRIITALVICMQLFSSLFLSVAIPAPASLARASEARVVLEASDVMIDDAGINEAGFLSDDDESESPNCAAGAEADGESDSYRGVDDSESSAWEGDDLDSYPAEVTSYDIGASDTCAATPSADDSYAADELRSQGVIYDGDYRYTWYSQRILPGEGLEIEGRHVSDEGYVVDADERIVVASSDLDRGAELEVPFGSGKAVVLDTGCASGTIDIYTDF